MINYQDRITPVNITELAEKEIFVFGSNLAGNHAGGTAKIAAEHFGAINGQGVGLQGKSYAIPTMQGGINTINPFVDYFISFAKEHTEKIFLVTKIGCGIAGFKVEEIAPLFYNAVEVENIYLPKEFWEYITTHPQVIKSYKGFDKNLQCRGFQYEIGKEYEIDGEIAVCQRGFHACQSPLEVLDYYFLDGNAQMSRFCEVEQSGNFSKEYASTGINYSTKIASSKIKINTELSFSDLIKLGVEWIKEKTSPTTLSRQFKNDNGGDSAKIGSSGNSAQIGSSGDSAKIGSSGDSAKIGSSGNSAQIGSSGNYAQIGSSGNYAQIGSSGNSAQIGSSGDYAQIGSSGDYAQIGSSGNSAQIGSSSNSAQIGSSGDYAQIGSSGDETKIYSSGDSAKISSSGNHARIISTGNDSIIMCAGHSSVVKAKKGSWITLAEWFFDETKDRYVPVCVKTEYVDGERIKEDTWYNLIDGEFTEISYK